MSQSNLPTLYPQYPRHNRVSFSRDLRSRVWEFTRGQCWYCGVHCNPFIDFCIDHVVPLARGGTNDIENLVPACSYCNQAKGILFIDEWRNNFSRATELDEEPWTHVSGLFWNERDSFFPEMRADEIKVYRRMQSRPTGDRS